MDNDNYLDLLQTMLSQIKIDDPHTRKLIERQIEDNRKKRDQEEVTKEILRRLRIQNKKLLEQVTILKTQLKESNTDRYKIRSTLNYLLKLNKSLSEALGACYLCWGEDPECSECHGIGSPGWRQVNKRFFNIYVLPCLERLYGLVKE